MEDVIADVIRRLFDERVRSFNIKTVEKRNQLETYFTLTRDYEGGTKEQLIIGSSGGGVSDIAFLLIRLLLLVNHPSKPRKMLFADEPIKDLSPDKRGAFWQLFQRITNEFDIQVLMITHEREYLAGSDAVWRFASRGGKTIAKIHTHRKLQIGQGKEATGLLPVRPSRHRKGKNRGRKR
jgi:DNA repair exonuclease SbcCD ATPase subunit